MWAESLDTLLSPLERRSASPRTVRWVADRLRNAFRLEGAGRLIRDLQRARLAEALAYAATASPFYRDRLRGRLPGRIGADDVDALVRELPITEAEPLHDWRRFLAVPESEVAALRTTAGTTGEPKIVAFTWTELQRLYNVWALGLRIEHRGTLRALIALPSEHGLWVGGPSATRAIERAGGLPLPLGTPRPHEALAWMRRLEPNVVVSSPSYLAALTRQAENEGFRIALDRITTGAEPLDVDRRAYLSDYWGAPVSESYGTTEIGGPQSIALPGCRGVHLNDLQLYTEIVEPGGDAPAEEGDLLFTPLKRAAMPLLRYRVGDRARWVRCSCGLPLRSIELARRSDDVVTVGGTHLRAQAIADRIGTVPGATGRVAFVVDRDGPIDRLRLRVEGAADEATVRAALLERHPRLEQALDTASLRLRLEIGAHLGDQVKAFRIVDRRP